MDGLTVGTQRRQRRQEHFARRVRKEDKRISEGVVENKKVCIADAR